LNPSPAVLQSNSLKWKRKTKPLELLSPKRPRTICPRPPGQTTRKEVSFAAREPDPATYWTQTLHWPREYFDETGEMSHLLARKKPTTSLRRKRSDTGAATASSTTPSDQKPSPIPTAMGPDVK
jgi:hypothetical protein